MPQTVTLVPTEGAYQKSIEATIVRETPTMWVVRLNESLATWRFSKRDHLRVGLVKKDFPRYRIDLQ